MSKEHDHHHHGPNCNHGGGSVLGHAHGVSDRLWLAFALNLGFAFIELVGGYWTNSVAITSDALHDFGDAMAIGLALVLEILSRKGSDAKFSYGYRRYSTMAAVITGLILVVGSILILVESVPRLFDPVVPHAEGMIVLAILGLSVNGYAAYRVSKGGSLSEKMIMWHLIEDVAGWALVMVGAVIIHFTGYAQIDAALAFVLAIWILVNVLRNLRAAFNVFMQGVPTQLDVEHILGHVRKTDGVKDVHHVHVWSLDGDKHVLTGHVVVNPGLTLNAIEEIKRKIKTTLLAHGIFEATLEIEPDGADCSDPSHPS